MEGRPLAEAELVRRAKRADVTAYSELVRCYQTVAFRTAYLVTGSVEDAEESAQDGFVKAFAAFGRFDEARRFRPLVYGSMTEPRAILSEWRSEALRYLKILPMSARLERIGPPEAPSFWIPEAHTLGYQRLGGGGAQERFRLSAPALVWIRDELTYRLEARVSRDRALGIARSLR